MARRQSLADLVSVTPPPAKVEPEPAVEDQAPVVVHDEVQAPADPGAVAADAILAPVPTVAPSVTAGGVAAPAPSPEPRPRPATRTKKASVPKYLQLERKEVRITAGQYDQLTALARRLNRQRPRGSEAPTERITENTLIRVAIDLLLERRDQLGGGTEDELRNSVSS